MTNGLLLRWLSRYSFNFVVVLLVVDAAVSVVGGWGPRDLVASPVDWMDVDLTGYLWLIVCCAVSAEVEVAGTRSVTRLPYPSRPFPFIPAANFTREKKVEGAAGREEEKCIGGHDCLMVTMAQDSGADGHSASSSSGDWNLRTGHRLARFDGSDCAKHVHSCQSAPGRIFRSQRLHPTAATRATGQRQLN